MSGFDVRRLTMCEDCCAEDDVDDALQMLVYPLHSPTVSVSLLQSATTSPVTVTLSRRLVIRDDPVPLIFLFHAVSDSPGISITAATAFLIHYSLRGFSYLILCI